MDELPLYDMIESYCESNFPDFEPNNCNLTDASSETFLDIFNQELSSQFSRVDEPSAFHGIINNVQNQLSTDFNEAAVQDQDHSSAPFKLIRDLLAKPSTLTHLSPMFVSTNSDLAINNAIDQTQGHFNASLNSMSVFQPREGTQSNNISKMTRQRRHSTKQSDLVCNVCGSPTIYRNYNVVACNACAAFFKRSLGKVYICPKENNCPLVGVWGHSICKACRLKKCLDIGMSPAAAGKKIRILEQERLEFLEDQQIRPGPQLGIKEFQFLYVLDKAHKKTYNETDIIEFRKRTPVFAKKDLEQERTSDLTPTNKGKAETFCKKILGFLNLTLNAQRKVIYRASWMLVIFRLCTRYFLETGSYILPSFVQFTPDRMWSNFPSVESPKLFIMSTKIKLHLQSKYYSLMEGLCVFEATRRVWREEVGQLSQFNHRLLSIVQIYTQQRNIWNFMDFCSEQLYGIAERLYFPPVQNPEVRNQLQ